MQGDLFEGREARDQGVAMLDSHDPAFKEHISAIIEQLALTQQPFGSDDVRERLTMQPSHPNQIGAAFLGACKRGIIEKVGKRQSSTASAHAREVNVYVGVR